MKGIVLAGGKGSRLHPLTQVISKQLLPVYDKPMIYYPISLLFLGGIREILVISTPRDLPSYRDLLGDGSQFGVSFSYIVQNSPDGLAQAFTLGADFIGESPSCLVLGDNIFYGDGLRRLMSKGTSTSNGAMILGYQVKDPQNYGVVEFDPSGKVISIQEKPKQPKSQFAVPGLYFYDSSAPARVKDLTPSARGELEITDLNLTYLNDGILNVELLGRGFAWLDSGTHESLLDASQFVHTVEKRQGLKIACLEEIAWRMGFISSEELNKLAHNQTSSSYGQYLRELLSVGP